MLQAEPVQYGLYNTPTELNCSTTLNTMQFVIDFSWYRGQEQDKTALPGRPQFENTDISHEGLYTCEVHISVVGVTIQKTINFTVIGKFFGQYFVIRLLRSGNGMYGLVYCSLIVGVTIQWLPLSSLASFQSLTVVYLRSGKRS